MFGIENTPFKNLDQEVFRNFQEKHLPAGAPLNSLFEKFCKITRKTVVGELKINPFSTNGPLV